VRTYGNIHYRVAPAAKASPLANLAWKIAFEACRRSGAFNHDQIIVLPL
jgi:hypothetical protein